MDIVQKRAAFTLNTVFIIGHSITIGLFLLGRQFPFAAETAIALVAYIGLIVFEKKTGHYLENYIRMLLIMSAVLNSFIGEYLKLYYFTDFFDKFLHMFGTFSFSLAIYSVINKAASVILQSKLFVFTLLVSLGALVGISMEIMEFLSDEFLGTYNQFGLFDTNLDMLFDMFGAVLAAVFTLIGRVDVLKTAK